MLKMLSAFVKLKLMSKEEHQKDTSVEFIKNLLEQIIGDDVEVVKNNMDTVFFTKGIDVSNRVVLATYRNLQTTGNFILILHSPLRGFSSNLFSLISLIYPKALVVDENEHE